MMEITLTNDEAKELAKKWGAKNIVADDIIDAYQEGKKKGVLKYADDLRKKRNENLLNAMAISNQEIQYLEQRLKLEVHKAFLRQLVADEECYHKTLIVIDMEKYLDNDVTKKAYGELIEKSKLLRRDKKFLIDFALVPNKDLNLDLLAGDGYQFHYDKKTKPRRA